MQIKQTRDLTDPIYHDALHIRQVVFVGEQHVPESLEIDQNENRARYFVYYDHDQPLGTARTLPEADGLHVQRVAVIKAARNRGIGKSLLTFIHQDAKARGAAFIRLDAQEQATGFYAALGYHFTDKARFVDAGIWHRQMQLDLRKAT